MTLRWGIAGASNIANDFCLALQSDLTANKNHKVIAIASRTKQNLKKFVEEHNIKRGYSSYTDLAKDPEVDVVYVAVLNPFHFEVAKLMLENGKNVVVEKPFCMNHKQAAELFQIAVQKNVYLIEAMWSRFFPVYRYLSTFLGKNNVKEVRVVHGFNGLENLRIIKKEMGGGIVLDIGCYALNLVLIAFNKAPESIKAVGKLNDNGVDLYFEAELTFSGGGKAFIICSGFEQLENTATIKTNSDTILIPTYWCPHKCVVNGESIEWPRHESDNKKLTYAHSLGLKYEADEIYNDLKAGKKYSEIMTPETTLLIAKIQDEILKQIGVQ